MKTFLLSCLLLAAGAGPAFAQLPLPAPTAADLLASTVESPQPFKNANAIVIHTPDSAALAYRKLAAILLNAGYTLDQNDQELLFINTKTRLAQGLPVVHQLSVAIAGWPGGSVLLLKDIYSLPSGAHVLPDLADGGEAHYQEVLGSPFRACWDEMQRVAEIYPNGKLAYARRP